MYQISAHWRQQPVRLWYGGPSALLSPEQTQAGPRCARLKHTLGEQSKTTHLQPFFCVTQLSLGTVQPQKRTSLSKQTQDIPNPSFPIFVILRSASPLKVKILAQDLGIMQPATSREAASG